MKHDPKGLIYTILAGDKPIVALAATGREAGELCKEKCFREELSALKSKGEPLYGTGVRLRARPTRYVLPPSRGFLLASVEGTAGVPQFEHPTQVQLYCMYLLVGRRLIYPRAPDSRPASGAKGPGCSPQPGLCAVRESIICGS